MLRALGIKLHPAVGAVIGAALVVAGLVRHGSPRLLVIGAVFLVTAVAAATCDRRKS